MVGGKGLYICPCKPRDKGSAHIYHNIMQEKLVISSNRKRDRRQSRDKSMYSLLRSSGCRLTVDRGMQNTTAMHRKSACNDEKPSCCTCACTYAHAHTRLTRTAVGHLLHASSRKHCCRACMRAWHHGKLEKHTRSRRRRRRRCRLRRFLLRASSSVGFGKPPPHAAPPRTLPCIERVRASAAHAHRPRAARRRDAAAGRRPARFKTVPGSATGGPATHRNTHAPRTRGY